jgi:hypothetical protein
VVNLERCLQASLASRQSPHSAWWRACCLASGGDLRCCMAGRGWSFVGSCPLAKPRTWQRHGMHGEMVALANSLVEPASPYPQRSQDQPGLRCQEQLTLEQGIEVHDDCRHVLLALLALLASLVAVTVMPGSSV